MCLNWCYSGLPSMGSHMWSYLIEYAGISPSHFRLAYRHTSCYCTSQMLCFFLQIEGKTLPKRLLPTLLQWSTTKPATSLRNACIYLCISKMNGLSNFDIKHLNSSTKFLDVFFPIGNSFLIGIDFNSLSNAFDIWNFLFFKKSVVQSRNHVCLQYTCKAKKFNRKTTQ